MAVSFDEAVNFIENTPKFVNVNGRNKSGNDNLKEVMNILGNPQDRHKCIHIAGTNGKGSTVRFTMSILCCMGYRTGCFISPHLEKINERISVSRLIDDRLQTWDIKDIEFVSAFEEVMAAVEENNNRGGSYLSYFEMLFAIAAVYFAKQDIDYVIYETGLGGRLDATNIINPEVTAITSIGLDHTAYLGDTIELIAGEKAGIIKPGVPVVYNTGEQTADLVIEKRARELSSEAINVAKASYITNDLSDKSIDFSLCSSYYSYHDIKLNVNGALYQLDNAATAIEVCNTLFKESGIIDEATIRKAMSLFFWAGRMERIGNRIIVDGAHNDDAIARYIEAIRLLSEDKSIILMFAVSADKDYASMIKHLSERLKLDRVYVTSLDSSRAVSAEAVSKIFVRYNGEIDIVVDDNISSALIAGYKYAEETDRMLFCVGSLYLVGSVKQIVKERFNNDKF